MKEELRRLGQQALETAAPAGPFVVQSAVSAAAFTAGLAATQLLGYACRISCATPFLGPALGCMGIGMASVLAGQASLRCQQSYAPPASVVTRRQNMLLDAVIGVALWKALGGRFRSVLPSDLFAPGALAVESLPSPGAQYASEMSKGELARLFRRDGCHHCGTRKGPVIGDHIPPNRMVWGSSKEWVPTAAAVAKSLGLSGPNKVGRSHRAVARKGPLARLQHKLRAALAMEPSMPKQRYYPQCKKCSLRQAPAVRANKRTLVLHFGGPRVPYFAGAMVGLRYYQASPPPGGGPRRKRGGRGGFEAEHDAFGLRRLLSAPATLQSNLSDLIKATGQWVSQGAVQGLKAPPRFFPLPWLGSPHNLLLS